MSDVTNPGVPPPAEADDVASLREALALERAKNEILLEQILKAEDEIADADVEEFSDVIPNEDRDFWRERILENREGSIGFLTRLRNRTAAPDGKAAGAAPAAAPKPLHNRETAKVGAARPADGLAAPAALKANLVCNRAQEIARRDNCSFTVAFRRAETELAG